MAGTKARVNKRIVIGKHKFKLEIYLALEGINDIAWEIFPENYEASLYAFSNKERIEKIIRKKYLYEDTKVRSTN